MYRFADGRNLSDVLGKPVRFQQTPIEDLKSKMAGRGASTHSPFRVGTSKLSRSKMASSGEFSCVFFVSLHY